MTTPLPPALAAQIEQLSPDALRAVVRRLQLTDDEANRLDTQFRAALSRVVEAMNAEHDRTLARLADDLRRDAVLEDEARTFLGEAEHAIDTWNLDVLHGLLQQLAEDVALALIEQAVELEQS